MASSIPESKGEPLIATPTDGPGVSAIPPLVPRVAVEPLLDERQYGKYGGCAKGGDVAPGWMSTALVAIVILAEPSLSERPKTR